MSIALIQMSIALIQSESRHGRKVRAATPSDVKAPDPSAIASNPSLDDLSRAACCVLGMPIDAIDLAGVLRRIDIAVADPATVLLSTPNLNWLVNSRSDAEFREALLDSDLCPADGMPIVWIARLIGVPIKQRVSGSDIFEALKERRTRQLSVFLFGGAQGVAAAAASAVNSVSAGLRCVGSLDPGYGTVDEMSRDDIIDTVNSSDADFLAVSLGAKKGQSWLQRNHHRLTIPIRAHLGATVNFQAGTVRRAPPWIRAWGFEWLWRIMEEPHLWRRYWSDGWVLLRLLVTRVLPLAVANRWYRVRCDRQPQELLIKTAQHHESVMISLCGDAIERHVAKAIAVLREVASGTERVILDLSATRMIDPRFFGLFLMLRKQLKARRAKLMFIGVPPAIERMFRLNEVGFLLATAPKGVSS
jgi:N-acetylglucosaminyldiphosphoundecaprenol N-acetyl-beta-D-mannosaminyltransferase